jgi:hypothetical protein
MTRLLLTLLLIAFVPLVKSQEALAASGCY